MSQRDDGGIVGQEGHHCTQRGHTGEVKEWFHQGTQQALQHFNYTKLYKDFTDSSGQYADTHQVEHGVDQQVMCRFHHGVEHIGHAHDAAQITEDKNHNEQAPYAARWFDTL